MDNIKPNISAEELQNSGELVVKDKRGRFIKGHKKLGGKKEGTKNFNTLFDEAIKELAKKEGKTLQQAEKEMMQVAYKEARNGNFNYFKDLMDRRYGQSIKPIDLTSGGIPFIKPSPEQQERANKALEDIL